MFKSLAILFVAVSLAFAVTSCNNSDTKCKEDCKKECCEKKGEHDEKCEADCEKPCCKKGEAVDTSNSATPPAHGDDDHGTDHGDHHNN